MDAMPVDQSLLWDHASQPFCPVAGDESASGSGGIGERLTSVVPWGGVEQFDTLGVISAGDGPPALSATDRVADRFVTRERAQRLAESDGLMPSVAASGR